MHLRPRVWGIDFIFRKIIHKKKKKTHVQNKSVSGEEAPCRQKGIVDPMCVCSGLYYATQDFCKKMFVYQCPYFYLSVHTSMSTYFV